LFEEHLTFRLRRSYDSLVGRHRFEPFERGGLRLFENIGDGSGEDFVVAAPSDPLLSTTLTTAGLLQIGRLDTGYYDHVCVDGRQIEDRRECPLVLLDHEAALPFERIVVIRQIDKSFLSFMLKNDAKAMPAALAEKSRSGVRLVRWRAVATCAVPVSERQAVQ
jgi:hypothetical protein